MRNQNKGLLVSQLLISVSILLITITQMENWASFSLFRKSVTILLMILGVANLFLFTVSFFKGRYSSKES